MSIGIVAIALSSSQPGKDSQSRLYWLNNQEEWSLFRGSFLIGGASGAFFVYFMLENVEFFETLIQGVVRYGGQHKKTEILMIK